MKHKLEDLIKFNYVITVVLVAIVTIYSGIIFTQLHQQGQTTNQSLINLCNRVNIERASLSIDEYNQWQSLAIAYKRNSLLESVTKGAIQKSYSDALANEIAFTNNLSVRPPTNCPKAVKQGNAYRQPRTYQIGDVLTDRVSVKATEIYLESLKLLSIDSK